MPDAEDIALPNDFPFRTAIFSIKINPAIGAGCAAVDIRGVCRIVSL